MSLTLKQTFAGLLCSASMLSAQVLFDGTQAYTQDFDTLPSSGSFTFENNSTLLGWYTAPASAQASNGGAGTNDPAPTVSGSRIYSWGDVDAPDRALGYFSRTSPTTNTGRFGIQLQNTSGAVIDALTITFDIEQWRRNSNDPGTTLNFEWLTTAASDNQLTAAAGYILDERGSRSGFIVGSNGSLNGNVSPNSQTISFTLTGLNWQNEEFLWLRWSVLNSMSSSAAVGIDNLSIVAPLATIPEPASAAALLGACGLIAAAAGRRQR